MRFASYKPDGPLRDLVEDFWLYEGYTGEHQRERILPSGTFEMVFNLREDELRIYDPAQDSCRRFAGAVISGPYAGSFASDTVEEAAILGVHFKPGGAHAVLGMPASALADTHVDLRTIWGPAASRAWDRLCTLRGANERFRFLERTIAARMPDPLPRHGAAREGLRLLTRSHGRTRVRDVAKAVDLSQRRFAAVFAAEVGLTPKLFARVQRFQHALRSSRTATSPDWAGIAAACGYFDQSHLIHDFVAFSGVSPSAYWQRMVALDRAGVHVKRHHMPLGGHSAFSNTRNRPAASSVIHRDAAGIPANPCAEPSS